MHHGMVLSAGGGGGRAEGAVDATARSAPPACRSALPESPDSAITADSWLCAVQQFHGEKELFKSEHLDPIAASTMTGKCRVLTLRQYQVRHVAVCPESMGQGCAA